MIRDFFKALFEEIKGFFVDPIDVGAPLFSGATIIWAVIIAFFIGILIVFINSLLVGKFVCILLNKRADSSEKAISPTEAGVKNIFLKSALKSNGAFPKIVITQDTDEKDLFKRKYYIEPKNESRAENLYGKNSRRIRTVIFSAVFLFILAIIAFKALPFLLDLVKDFGELI